MLWRFSLVLAAALWRSHHGLSVYESKDLCMDPTNGLLRPTACTGTTVDYTGLVTQASARARTLDSYIGYSFPQNRISFTASMHIINELRRYSTTAVNAYAICKRGKNALYMTPRFLLRNDFRSKLHSRILYTVFKLCDRSYSEVANGVAKIVTENIRVYDMQAISTIRHHLHGVWNSSQQAYTFEASTRLLREAPVLQTSEYDAKYFVYNTWRSSSILMKLNRALQSRHDENTEREVQIVLWAAVSRSQIDHLKDVSSDFNGPAAIVHSFLLSSREAAESPHCDMNLCNDRDPNYAVISKFLVDELSMVKASKLASECRCCLLDIGHFDESTNDVLEDSTLEMTYEKLGSISVEGWLKRDEALPERCDNRESQARGRPDVSPGTQVPENIYASPLESISGRYAQPTEQSRNISNDVLTHNDHKYGYVFTQLYEDLSSGKKSSCPSQCMCISTYPTMHVYCRLETIRVEDVVVKQDAVTANASYKPVIVQGGNISLFAWQSHTCEKAHCYRGTPSALCLDDWSSRYARCGYHLFNQPKELETAISMVSSQIYEHQLEWEMQVAALGSHPHIPGFLICGKLSERAMIPLSDMFIYCPTALVMTPHNVNHERYFAHELCLGQSNCPYLHVLDSHPIIPSLYNRREIEETLFGHRIPYALPNSGNAYNTVIQHDSLLPGTSSAVDPIKGRNSSTTTLGTSRYLEGVDSVEGMLAEQITEGPTFESTPLTEGFYYDIPLSRIAVGGELDRKFQKKKNASAPRLQTSSVRFPALENYLEYLFTIKGPAELAAECHEYAAHGNNQHQLSEEFQARLAIMKLSSIVMIVNCHKPKIIVHQVPTTLTEFMDKRLPPNYVQESGGVYLDAQVAVDERLSHEFVNHICKTPTDTGKRVQKRSAAITFIYVPSTARLEASLKRISNLMESNFMIETDDPSNFLPDNKVKVDAGFNSTESEGFTQTNPIPNFTESPLILESSDTITITINNEELTACDNRYNYCTLNTDCAIEDTEGCFYAPDTSIRYCRRYTSMKACDTKSGTCFLMNGPGCYTDDTGTQKCAFYSGTVVCTDHGWCTTLHADDCFVGKLNAKYCLKQSKMLIIDEKNNAITPDDGGCFETEGTQVCLKSRYRYICVQRLGLCQNIRANMTYYDTENNLRRIINGFNCSVDTGSCQNISESPCFSDSSTNERYCFAGTSLALCYGTQCTNLNSQLCFTVLTGSLCVRKTASTVTNHTGDIFPLDDYNCFNGDRGDRYCFRSSFANLRKHYETTVVYVDTDMLYDYSSGSTLSVHGSVAMFCSGDPTSEDCNVVDDGGCFTATDNRTYCAGERYIGFCNNAGRESLFKLIKCTTSDDHTQECPFSGVNLVCFGGSYCLEATRPSCTCTPNKICSFSGSGECECLGDSTCAVTAEPFFGNYICDSQSCRDDPNSLTTCYCFQDGLCTTADGDSCLCDENYRCAILRISSGNVDRYPDSTPPDGEWKIGQEHETEVPFDTIRPGIPDSENSVIAESSESPVVIPIANSESTSKSKPVKEDPQLIKRYASDNGKSTIIPLKDFLRTEEKNTVSPRELEIQYNRNPFV